MLQTLEFSLPELLERVRAGQIPMSAKAQVTYDDAALTAPVPTEQSPAEVAAALFAQWEQEDVQRTPEEQADNERIYAEIETNGIPRVRL